MKELKEELVTLLIFLGAIGANLVLAITFKKIDLEFLSLEIGFLTAIQILGFFISLVKNCQELIMVVPFMSLLTVLVVFLTLVFAIDGLMSILVFFVGVIVGLILRRI